MPAGQGEQQPLLGSGRQDSGGHGGRGGKKFDIVGSTRHLLLGSWINVLIVFLPLAFVAEQVGWSAALRFAFSFMAIVPLAKVRPILSCTAHVVMSILDWP